MSVLRAQLDEKILKITMLQSISQQNDSEFPLDQNQISSKEAPNEAITQLEEIEKPDYEGILQLKSNEIESLRATIEQKDQSLRDFTEFISQQTEKISQLEKLAQQQE